eukprot:6476700-Amphidinium_carterae.2
MDCKTRLTYTSRNKDSNGTDKTASTPQQLQAAAAAAAAVAVQEAPVNTKVEHAEASVEQIHTLQRRLQRQQQEMMQSVRAELVGELRLTAAAMQQQQQQQAIPPVFQQHQQQPQQPQPVHDLTTQRQPTQIRVGDSDSDMEWVEEGNHP